jgi:hypothetical protein
VDLATATLIGVVVGAVLGWVIALFQRQADRHARAIERKYERLHAASRSLRLSVIQAAQLHYSRTIIAMFLDVTAWPSLRWAQFGRTLAETGASLALVIDDLPGDLSEEYEEAASALFGATSADNRKLRRYTNAALALRRAVEAKARSLR